MQAFIYIQWVNKTLKLIILWTENYNSSNYCKALEHKYPLELDAVYLAYFSGIYKNMFNF